ncbi:hypothetical protein ACRRTK_012333 [Alexandromys fortis]
MVLFTELESSKTVAVGLEARPSLSSAKPKLTQGKILGILFCFVCFFSKQGFSVALEPVLELNFVDQAGLKLTEIRLPLPPKCWD